jgi:cell wall assembly regulator SMI1
LKELLEKYLIAIDKLGGDSRQLIFENPANETDILEIEKKLSYKLPNDFRNILLTVSSHCEFKWFLPDNFSLPDQLRQIFCGELHWGTDFILQFNESKDGWIKEAFPNIENVYDKVWHNKFVFQEVGNGDYISIDMASENLGKVIYLSHDDGEGHGFVMANSFYDLLRNWTKLGCVGGEDWQWLPFCKDKTSGIDPDCDNAKLWYKTIGLT